MFGLSQGTALEVWPQWVKISFNTSAVTTVNTQVWNTWNLNAGTQGTQATGVLQVWQGWVTGAATTGVTIQVTGAEIWDTWNLPFVNLGNQAPAVIHRETEQERRARVQWELREAERRKVAETERVLAVERARKLLLENLTEDQRRELAEKRHFHLRSRSGRLFRVLVGSGRHGNIKEIVGDRAVRSFCVSPIGEMPEDDAILGQKLAIEHAEEDFLRAANVTELRPAA